MITLPGFHDPHVHIWKVGHMRTTMVDVRGVRSIEELKSEIATFAATLPENVWLEGRGYNEAILAEGRHPTREDLDAAVSDRPAFLQRTCAHIGVANSAALALAGIDENTDPPPGGEIDRDEAGHPTGVLRETALGLLKRVIPTPTREEFEAMILAGCEHLLSLGITSATDPAVTPDLLDAYRHLDSIGRLPMRVQCMAIRRPDGGTETFPLPERHLSDRLRIDSVKFFADGGLSGATAALSVPYRHAHTRGIVRFEEEELFDLAWEAHAAGFRIGTHAIGDVAIETVLNVYQGLSGRKPGPRHRIEHMGLPNHEQLRRAARLGVIAVSQPIFLDELGDNFLRYLPDAFIPRCYPIRAMLDAGLGVALSSDGPVVRDLNPLRGIRAAMLRHTATGQPIAPEQAITFDEALRGYTLGGAIASGDGRLPQGDTVTLSEDPSLVPPEQLTDIGVVRTSVGGVWVFEN